MQIHRELLQEQEVGERRWRRLTAGSYGTHRFGSCTNTRGPHGREAGPLDAVCDLVGALTFFQAAECQTYLHDSGYSGRQALCKNASSGEGRPVDCGGRPSRPFRLLP